MVKIQFDFITARYFYARKHAARFFLLLAFLPLPLSSIVSTRTNLDYVARKIPINLQYASYFISLLFKIREAYAIGRSLFISIII